METPCARYFPAIVCGEFDSPVDALLALCVAHDEALELAVAASLTAGNGEVECIVTKVDGGRDVAALRSEQGRWLACNAFLDCCRSTRPDAERELRKRLKRGRQGCIGVLPPPRQSMDEKKPAR